jgi:(R,R)-butanediol dehydrogenase/meso-butanediol dehydrogenase/diacetyl reductase
MTAPTMSAVVWHAPLDVRLDEVPLPPLPGPGQVLVEVIRCGLCGTDRRTYERAPSPHPDRPHPLTGHSGPVILGHEVVGRIVACGPDISSPLEPGLRVAVNPTWSCGTCPPCRRGEQQLCEIFGCSGMTADGGLASHMIAPAVGLAPVPDTVSDDAAAMAEPLAVAVHAVLRSGLRPNDRVVVAGLGPIGACVALSAQALGAGEVLVAVRSEQRRRLAAELGFAVIAGPDAGASPAGESLPRDYADVAFDCAGAAETLELCLRATRPGGRIVVPAVSAGRTPVAVARLVTGERTLTGSFGYNGDIARAVALMANGSVDVRPLISAVLPLADVPAWLAGPAAGNRGPKVLVDPSA